MKRPVRKQSEKNEMRLIHFKNEPMHFKHQIGYFLLSIRLVTQQRWLPDKHFAI